MSRISVYSNRLYLIAGMQRHGSSNSPNLGISNSQLQLSQDAHCLELVVTVQALHTLFANGSSHP